GCEPLTGRIDPPCDSHFAPTLPRPPHPAPNVRDDRDTPLSRDGMAADIKVTSGKSAEWPSLRKYGRLASSDTLGLQSSPAKSYDLCGYKWAAHLIFDGERI